MTHLIQTIGNPLQIAFLKAWDTLHIFLAIEYIDEKDMWRRDFWKTGELGKEAGCPTLRWTTWSDPGEDIQMEGAPTSQVAVDRFVFKQKRNLPRWAVTCHGARSATLRGVSGCGIERPPPSHNDLGLHLHGPQPLVLGVFVEGSDVTDNARFSVC